LAAEINEQPKRQTPLYINEYYLPMSQFSSTKKLVESKLSKEDAEEANSTQGIGTFLKQLEERLGALHDSVVTVHFVQKWHLVCQGANRHTFVHPGEFHPSKAGGYVSA
jgi:hypothetical protein